MTAETWYLLLNLWSRYPIPYNITFETEADCDYAGKSLQTRAKIKGWQLDYVCWSAQKPPVRKLGGAQ